MVTLHKITSFFNNYLQIHDYADYFYNGLQVEGKAKINKIAFAVDAGMQTFKQAKNHDADMIVVHHGHFNKSNPSITGWKKERIQFLLNNDISLYVAHIPLDAHPHVGNNIQLLKLLQAKPIEEFCGNKGKTLSWIGKTEKPISLKDIVTKLTNQLNPKLIVLPFGKSKIEHIAVCTGGPGYKIINDVIDATVDLYISGDPIEIYQTAQDAKINVIFAGHYATETLGIKALQEKVQQEFNIQTTFINIPTGL